MFNQPTCYMSPKLEGTSRTNNKDRGVFARQWIRTGELLMVWGGEVITAEQLTQLDVMSQRITLQVEEDLYMVPSHEGPADWVNHSCDPNAGMSGQIVLVAIRDIALGEEICYVYAMSDGSPYDEFECSCGASNCRRRVTGDDWRRPDLWERYAGYFSPYLQRRIDQIWEDGAKNKLVLIA
jgi:hypothetical protein